MEILSKLKLSILKQNRTIFILFVAGLLIRFYHLGALSLTDDELTTFVRVNHSFFDTIRLLGGAEFPPLHFAILSLWTKIFGTSEWALRAPSAIYSALTVIVIYKLGKELFSQEAGLMAAALLTFSPFALHYAQFAKMYALFGLLAAMSFLFFFRFLKGRDNAYPFYLMTGLLCCYTIYSGFLLLVAQSVIFVFLGDRKKRKQWLMGQLIILIFCLPWLVYILNAKHEMWGLVRATASFDYLGYCWRSFSLIIGSRLEIWTHESWSAYLFKLRMGEINSFLFVFLIVFVLMDGLSVSYYFLLMWLFIPLFAYFMFDHFVVHMNLEARYIGFLQVPLFLLVGSQMSKAPRFVKCLIVSIMIGISMANVWLYFRDSMRFPYQDWRSTAKELTQDLGRNDIVLYYFSPTEFSYYYKTDTSRFFLLPPQQWSSGFLEKKGMFNSRVHGIFILYKDGEEPAPDWASLIKFKGFSLDYKVWNAGNGFLHFQRNALQP